MAEIKSPLGSSNVNIKEPRHFTVSDETDGDEGASAFQGNPMSGQNPQHPQHPQYQQEPQQQPQQARGPIVFNSTEPVAPPASQMLQHPQYQQPQQSPQNPVQPVQHGSYEEAMAYRQQYMAQKRAQEEQQVKSERSNIEVLIGIGRKFRDVPVQSDSGATSFRISTLKSKERQHVAQAMDVLLSKKTNEDLHKVRNVVLSYCIVSIEGRPLDIVLGCQNVGEEDRFYIREAFVKELDDNVASFLFANFEKLDKESREKYSLSSSEELKEVAEAISKSGQGR